MAWETLPCSLFEQFAMEQSPSEPPRKKRGRPKKADKLLQQQSNASVATKLDTPTVRQKKKKGFSNSVPVSSGRKKPQQGLSPSLTKSSDSDAEEDIATLAPDKDESTGSDANVGQQVHGVVDGMFDAGFLVTVRVGDSDTVFRGVVFGPGLSLPLNAENDVAPKLKRMNHDDETLDAHVAPSSSMLNEAGLEAAHVPSTASTPGLMHAPVNSASNLASSAVSPTGEGHRTTTIVGSMGVSPTNIPQPQPQQQLAASARGSPAGYSPVAPYRSPMFVQSPLPNASGAGSFYYARNPNGNHGPAYFGPPNGAFPGPYAFPYPGRAEYQAVSSQFAAAATAPAPAPAPVTAASISPLPNMQQGTVPPRT